MRTINFNNKKITPSKIICVGRNYIDHIKELDNELPNSMVIFNKPNSSINNQILYFNEYTRFESEICFLIDNKKLIGIGIGLDLTKTVIQNDLKEKRLPWERAKSFNGSAVLSDFVFLDEKIQKIQMKMFINDKLIQVATNDLMIYKPIEIIKEIDSFMDLENGDVIMSGTPKGVGTYKINDNFYGELYLDDELVLKTSWLVKK